MAGDPISVACPSCGAALNVGDQFCESCGASVVSAAAVSAAALGTAVVATPPIPSAEHEVGTTLLAPPDQRDETVADGLPPVRRCQCGGEFDSDGWCTICGSPQPRPRDHWEEQPAPWVGAVCDRGIVHRRNEDAMATAAEEAVGSSAVLVVCDGVTTARDSDQASIAAARAAREVLLGGYPSAPTSISGRVVHWSEVMTRAAVAANDEAVALAAATISQPDPPASTFAAAIVQGPLIIAGCVGDSRVYWLPDVGAAMQVTTDDSWATEQIAAGVTRLEAEADPRAHSITRWLGVDSPDCAARPTSVTVEDSDGWLLVCSDGLWNYCSDAEALSTLVRKVADATSSAPLAMAGALVKWANEQGGHDNVTAALARLLAPAPASTARSFPTAGAPGPDQ
jgi:serine/threonine protein phosphatase PrpC